MHTPHNLSDHYRRHPDPYKPATQPPKSNLLSLPNSLRPHHTRSATRFTTPNQTFKMSGNGYLVQPCTLQASGNGYVVQPCSLMKKGNGYVVQPCTLQASGNGYVVQPCTLQ